MVINLWSGPRNISTALMYSFANREDTKVLDEPYYAHYLNLTGLNHPGRDEVLESQSVNQKEVDNLVLTNYSKDVIFVKNMAHHAEGLDLGFTSKTKNIFLLREPDQMITSYIQQIPNPTLQDLAYEYQYNLLNETVDKGDTPIVIDSKDLLTNPKQYLTKLCDKLEISFSSKMLSWGKGPIAEDGVWAEYWYKSVHNSTSFQSYRRKEDKVPVELNELLEKCNYFYNELIKYKL